MNLSELQFKPGKPGDAIIVDEPLSSEGVHSPSGYSADTLEYYGGYVVCESVHPKVMPLLLAAPGMLKVLDGIEDDIRNGRFQADTMAGWLADVRKRIAAAVPKG